MCHSLYLIHLLSSYSISAEATLHIETTPVVVREDEGVAMVCVSVQDPTVDCPIAFSFEVNVITSDGNASKYSIL